MSTSSVLLTVAGIDVVWDGERLTFLAGMQIDGDGSGGNAYGDPCFQPDTTYQPALNAAIDRFIVLPPQLIEAVAPIVIGCKALVTNASTGQSCSAVVGDIGPHTKIGEASIACAEAVGVPSNPVTGGESRRIIRYAIWPGEAAVCDGKIYKLQARAI